jgi:hypothetical protein
MVSHQPLKLLAAVLAAAVRVMNRRIGLATTPDRHHQGVGDELMLLPGLAVGALLAVLLSFDESVVSIFLRNLNVKTLPRKLWEGIRFDLSREPAAVSVLLLGATCAVVIVGILIFPGLRKNALLPVKVKVRPGSV